MLRCPIRSGSAKMKLLLDTQVLLWADNDPDKLSPTARDLLSDPANARLLSVASLWEIQIKAQLGKLQLRLPLTNLMEEQARKNAVEILPVTASHVFELSQLPAVHKDPFDRLIASVARVENATLLSADPVFRGYPVTVAW